MNDARLRDVGIQTYSVPLVAPWRSARVVLTRRAGWLVRIEDDDGIGGVGECAPLPEAGTESFGSAERALMAWRERSSGRSPVEALAALDPMGDTPAARCAIECALMDLLARRGNVSLGRWLSDTCLTSVRVNANVGIADAGLAARCVSAVEVGFRVLKIKLGVGKPDAERVALERAAASLPPDASLRLDPNGAWDERSARQWLRWLARMPVESVEEPLSSAAPDRLRDLQEGVAFPLALDESVPALLECGGGQPCPVRRLVLKPMVLGGARPTLAAANRCADAGVETVITTTLEAAPGRWLCAQVAAASGPSPPHGLDTGRWLAEDLGEGPAVAAGVCDLTQCQGLGFAVV